VSLKDGQHGVGPYDNIEMIIDSLATCIFGHTPISFDTKSIVLYLIPWVDIPPHREYRMFVNNNIMTALSQQRIYDVFPKRSAEEYIKDIMIIHHYFNNVMKQRIEYKTSYVCDIAILENDEPYFIEIDSFGKEYASSSSLYSWLDDYEKLYGANKSTIYFRYTIQNSSLRFDDVPTY
jgi:hypothetical protein